MKKRHKNHVVEPVKEYVFLNYARAVYKYYKEYYDAGIRFVGDYIYKEADWKVIIGEWTRPEIMRIYEMITEHKSEFYT